MRTLQVQFPHVFEATRYLIVEASASSRERAREEVAAFAGRVGFETLKDLDRINPGILFSNELLDAFPVHRLTIKEGKLVEFYITLTSGNNFDWVLDALSTPRLSDYLMESGIELVEGQILEVSLASEDWFERVSEKLVAGYLITVDYGADATELYDAEQRFQGTLRAFHQHQFVNDVLSHPGDIDLTTTIDWTNVKRLGKRFGFETLEFSPRISFAACRVVGRLDRHSKEHNWRC